LRLLLKRILNVVSQLI